MRIGMIGTGTVGRTIGARLIELGQSVMYGTRDVEKTMARTEANGFGLPPFSQWVKEQPQIELGTFKEAAAYGEVVFNVTGGGVSLAALNLAGEEQLEGKILIDVSNPLDFSQGFPPTMTICNTDSLAEQIQRMFPKTKVVKTLNTVAAPVMVNPALVPGDHNIFIGGNDDEAKMQVTGWLQAWFGWQPASVIDLGDISTARGTEMLLPLWARLFGIIQNPYYNFHIAMRSSST